MYYSFENLVLNNLDFVLFKTFQILTLLIKLNYLNFISTKTYYNNNDNNTNKPQQFCPAYFIDIVVELAESSGLLFNSLYELYQQNFNYFTMFKISMTIYNV